MTRKPPRLYDHIENTKGRWAAIVENIRWFTATPDEVREYQEKIK